MQIMKKTPNLLLNTCVISILVSLYFTREAGSETMQVDSGTTEDYLLSCQKENGAFGPFDQEYSDLAWNYPAVYALKLLDIDIPRSEDCLRNGLWASYRRPDAHPTDLYWDFYQKIELHLLLAKDLSQIHKNVNPSRKKGAVGIDIDIPLELIYLDRENKSYAPYKIGGFHDITSLWYMAGSLVHIGATFNNAVVAKKFIEKRRSANGAFVNAYGDHPQLNDSDAHIISTYHALMTMDVLKIPIPNANKSAAWIKSCQTKAGGFRWSPGSQAASNEEDVWYTWAAIRALHLLGHKPNDVEACVSWLNSLQNVDGGFGDRPGWKSRLYSTFYAVHALKVLTGNAKNAISNKRINIKQPKAIPEGKFLIFQAQFKTPTKYDQTDNPADMVESIYKSGFHLIGVKAEDVSKARAYVQSKGYPLEIVANPECYEHEILRFGGHPANHVCNWIIPPVMSTDQRLNFDAAHKAGTQKLPWSVYAQKVIAPVRKLGSLVYPEMEYSMLSAYQVYDDGLAGDAGYNAIIASLGWPSWDWVRHFPYRERWEGRLPMITDSDSHGGIKTWSDRLDRQRTLYIAKSHPLEFFLNACRENRTVCVIRDGDVFEGVVYYGSDVAVAYVKKHKKNWQWW